MITYNKFFNKLNIVAALASVFIFSACNKELPEPIPNDFPLASASETVLKKLDAPEFSILKTAVEKASTFNSTTGKLSDVLGNPAGELTFFAPDNTAILTSFSLLGLPADASSLNFFSAGKLDTLLKYHIIGGRTLKTSNFTTTFPNMYLQSALILSAPSAALPPGLRMPIFPAKAGSASFVNGVPITGPDLTASNGVMHKTAIALLPPDQVLWQRIATNPDYSYFKAAVNKADQGDANKTLESALSNPAANLTVFAPTNAAFQALLTAQITPGVLPVVKNQYITTGLVPQIMAANPGMSQADALQIATAMAETEPHKTTILNLAQAQAASIASTPDVFQNPLLAGVLTPETVKGLVVYHIMGTRANTVNMPTTETKFPTLLNGAITAHPGIGLKSVFGPTGVTAATVKGAANPTASNVLINPFVNGTSDQNFINGSMHRIDQVLLPQ